MSQEGNTKPSCQFQLYRWAFTLKEDAISLKDLISQLKSFCKEWVFQIEQGQETEYTHYQGIFSLKNKEYFSTVKNLFPNSIHLEACMNWWASIKYCTKSETRVRGPYRWDKPIIKTIDDLLPWQKLCLDSVLEEPNDRTVTWYYDPIGGAGKTAMAKYLAVHHNATVLSNGKASDIAFSVGEDTKIVVFNLTRTTEERFNYQALESIKDGLLFSPKYESRTKIFNPPHVVVFANFKPHMKSLSKDRWNIICMCSPGDNPEDYE